MSEIDSFLLTNANPAAHRYTIKTGGFEEIRQKLLILQNDPYYVPDLKAGSVVHIHEDEVFDYILNNPDGTTEGNETGTIIEQQQ
jgi:hypothetical protein